jgi:hypothetical protein
MVTGSTGFEDRLLPSFAAGQSDPQPQSMMSVKPRPITEIEEARVAQYQSDAERAKKRELLELFRRCPIPEAELMNHLGLYINRQLLSRFFFLNHLYQQILQVHGVVIEFGVRWGQSLALFESLRGMYEPYNHNRRILGFDTFEGFVGTSAKDGAAAIIADGAYSVTEGYDLYLTRLLEYHESESPIAHIRKFELIKGDATRTIHEYLERHPETIVALAYFDFDLYEPTKQCLEAIRPHLTKGSVLAFDELNHQDFPGETLALKEVFGLDTYRIRRTPLASLPSYVVIE